MNTSVQQTAHAFVSLYKALPEEVREEVRRLMEKLDKTEFESTDAWQHLSQVSFANEWNKPENAYWNIYLATPNSISKGEQTGEPIIRTTEKNKSQGFSKWRTLLHRFVYRCPPITSLITRMPINGKAL